MGGLAPESRAEPSDGHRTWTLLGSDGRPYESDAPGRLGGHRRSRIYGRLDCRSALRAIAGGGYVANRVFFASEDDARAAGFRPCAICLPTEYAAWKRDVETAAEPSGSPVCVNRGGSARFERRLGR